MTAPGASKYVTAVEGGSKDTKADTVLLHCGKKKVTFKVSSCMSGAWQCQQVNIVLQTIINTVYKQGMRDAKA